MRRVLDVLKITPQQFLEIIKGPPRFKIHALLHPNIPPTGSEQKEEGYERRLGEAYLEFFNAFVISDEGDTIQHTSAYVLTGKASEGSMAAAILKSGKRLWISNQHQGLEKDFLYYRKH